MESLSKYLNNSTTDSSYSISPEEACKRKCDIFNGSAGDLHIADGYNCDKCKNRGYIYEPLSYEYFGRTIWTENAVPCECGKIRSVLSKLSRSGLRNVMDKYTMDAYKTTEPWQAKLKETVQSFLKYGEDNWLYIGGAPGSGKTHLCTVAALQLLKRNKEVYYMMWREDAPALKRLVNESEEYDKRLKALKEVDVLYIDDLFKTGRTERGEKQRPTSADINLAFEIINHRSVANKKTIISSECTDADLIDIDQALAGRIIEKSQPYCISLKGKEKDYRLKGNLTL